MDYIYIFERKLVLDIKSLRLGQSGIDKHVAADALEGDGSG